MDRWYVTHYKYDPDRKQVRHIFLKAFSNQKGQMKYFKKVAQELQARKLVEEVPRKETITGDIMCRVITRECVKTGGEAAGMVPILFDLGV